MKFPPIRLKVVLLGVAEIVLFGSIIALTVFHWNNITRTVPSNHSAHST